jgi:hypothetical protein
MPGELSRLKRALDEWIAYADTRRNVLLAAGQISDILARADQLNVEAQHAERVKELGDFAR